MLVDQHGNPLGNPTPTTTTAEPQLAALATAPPSAPQDANAPIAHPANWGGKCTYGNVGAYSRAVRAQALVGVASAERQAALAKMALADLGPCTTPQLNHLLGAKGGLANGKGGWAQALACAGVRGTVTPRGVVVAEHNGRRLVYLPGQEAQVAALVASLVAASTPSTSQANALPAPAVDASATTALAQS